MRQYFVLTALVLLAAGLCGCGGRAAKPIVIENDFDTRLSCAHLAGERDNNLKRLEELTGESRDKFTNNAGMLVVSPLFLDFSQTQKREAEAIMARNQRIDTLMADKSCAPTG